MRNKKGGAEAGTALICPISGHSGRRSDLRIAFVGARAAGSAARLGRLVLHRAVVIGFLAANGRRQSVERDALFRFLAFVIAGAAVRAAFAALTAFEALFAIAARAALLAIFRLDFALGIGELEILVAVLIAVAVFVTPPALLFEAPPGLAQDAEIMVGELQIIFGLDTVAGKLGVARHEHRPDSRRR